MKRGSWLKLKAWPFPNIITPKAAFRSSIHLFHPVQVHVLKNSLEYWCNESQFYYFNIRQKCPTTFSQWRNQERLCAGKREKLWMNSCQPPQKILLRFPLTKKWSKLSRPQQTSFFSTSRAKNGNFHSYMKRLHFEQSPLRPVSVTQMQ